ncbi:MAG: hypothetical protein H6746_19590 [Deltaproteobacteria bacterium]|nr:hypothetical protein [Deltaproteobacteria bacterium]
MISSHSLQVAQALVSSALLGLTVVCLPLALARAARVFADPAARRDRLVVPLLLAAIALGALLRLGLVPHRLATVFIGFQRAHEAIDLVPFAHYGAGASALYHVAFQFLPAGHRTMMAVNAVCACLTLPLIAAFAARLFRDRLTGALTALLVALVPVFVRNDTSDANILPCLLWAFAGLVLWLEHLDDRRPLPLAAATVLLALAATGRPELPALLPLLLLASAALHPAGLRPLLSRPVLLAGAAFLALIAPHVLHVAHAIGWLAATDALPGADAQHLANPSRLLFDHNLLAHPSLFPLALTLLGLAAVALPPTRRPALVLLALIVATLFAYAVDLDDSNLARVLVPAALLMTMLAAATLSWLRSRPRGLLWLSIALTLTALSAVPSAARLFAPTNEAQEERLIDALPALLPGDTPYTLVVRGPGDTDEANPDSRFTHLYFPAYAFEPPRGPGEVWTIDAWRESPRWDRPAFFYLGFRCYAEFRSQGGPPPRGDNLRPSCRAMQQEFRLVPVSELELPNHGDPWMPYYGDAPTLRVGLYRVTPPAGGSAPEP